jgi:CheY-like chemotaxis protein
MSHNILLIDDDSDFRSQAKEMFQHFGFIVTECEGEQQAYELAKNRAFDLAVIDLMMENSDSGFTLSHHFKKDYPKMPIVLLSSAASEMSIDFSMESASERSWIKADALLNKPIRFEQLLYETQRLLGVLATRAH